MQISIGCPELPALRTCCCGMNALCEHDRIPRGLNKRAVCFVKWLVDQNHARRPILVRRHELLALLKRRVFAYSHSIVAGGFPEIS